MEKVDWYAQHNPTKEWMWKVTISGSHRIECGKTDTKYFHVVVSDLFKLLEVLQLIIKEYNSIDSITINDREDIKNVYLYDDIMSKGTIFTENFKTHVHKVEGKALTKRNDSDAKGDRE